MTKSIYDQHRAAFANVSAFIVAQYGERVATVAFKYPKDGAGRLWCYLHIIGLPMVRGYANGYGYDKHRAAFDNALSKPVKLEKWQEPENYTDEIAFYEALQTESRKDSGRDWQAVVRACDSTETMKIWGAV